ncbi:hypothetical protein [Nocardia jiangxiensis]|uniref:Uncharacterized protein n=1 Tax=Nocardia jiangxiensis TaxID=282685 RepID=A0ABW6SDA4_9NOCA|nr:hypothetical protein [Nocardia jiangxiensis]
MSDRTLLRAPHFSLTWTWWPTEVADGPAAQFEVAARLADITARHGLLRPDRLRCQWCVAGRIVPRVLTTITLDHRLDDPATAEALLEARPSDLDPAATICDLVLTGPGTWLDENAIPHTEDDILLLDIDLARPDATVTAETFHDIWMPHDFHGAPHPNIHRHNAPRLAATLTDIAATLRTPTDPGDPSPYGTPLPQGLTNALDDTGHPADVLPHHPR